MSMFGFGAAAPAEPSGPSSLELAKVCSKVELRPRKEASHNRVKAMANLGIVILIIAY